MTDQLDLDGLLLRIGQDFDGELHLTEEEALALISQAREAERMRGALTPSGETKAAYLGEFKMPVTAIYFDDDGEPEEVTEQITVTWDVIKEIMAAISARALAPATGGGDA